MALPNRRDAATPSRVPPADAKPADGGSAAGASLGADQRDALYVLGYSFIQHRHTDKAMTLFEALAALYPDDPHVQKSLSYLYLTARRYDEALALAERWRAGAGEVGPAAEASIALIRSRALWGLERGDEARRQLDLYIRLQQQAGAARGRTGAGGRER